MEDSKITYRYWWSNFTGAINLNIASLQNVMSGRSAFSCERTDTARRWDCSWYLFYRSLDCMNHVHCLLLDLTRSERRSVTSINFEQYWTPLRSISYGVSLPTKRRSITAVRRAKSFGGQITTHDEREHFRLEQTTKEEKGLLYGDSLGDCHKFVSVFCVSVSILLCGGEGKRSCQD